MNEIVYIVNLPLTLKSYALSNQVHQGKVANETLRIHHFSGEGGFMWGRSIEGFSYWDELEDDMVHNQLVHSEWKS